MSIWSSQDTIRDVAESVGIGNLPEDLAKALAQDVEYRLTMITQEALKFMRHSRSKVLTVGHISKALRVLEVEPLFGYQSNKPLRYGEAPLGPGQPLYYLEDEEVDFEKLVNTPLPKVPREVSFTGHWLAVEGVQPFINQNGNLQGSAESGFNKSAPSHTLSAMTGEGTAGGKPLVKHVISKELQIYFDKVVEAISERDSKDIHAIAVYSVGSDPGLQQLVPYFVQFIREKVTHELLDLFTLQSMMELTAALLQNKYLDLRPYIVAITGAILTCLIGKRLGPDPMPSTDSYPLRDLAASLIHTVSQRYRDVSHTLLPSLANAFLKLFMDPHKPYGTYYGAILGLQAVGGVQAVRLLVLPCVEKFELFIRDDIINDTNKKLEADVVLQALVNSLKQIKDDQLRKFDMLHPNEGDDFLNPDETKQDLVTAFGELAAEKIWETGDGKLIKILILEKKEADERERREIEAEERRKQGEDGKGKGP